MKKIIEHNFDGLTTDISGYDENKTNLGTLINQNTGSLLSDKWAGPRTYALARYIEDTTTAGTQTFIGLIPYTNDVDWVFLGDSSASASVTQRYFHLYEFTKSTWSLHYVGNITLGSFASSGFRSFFVTLDQYTTGQASTSGTAVTGSGGAAWQTARIAAGARIGFGSTDPTQISTWYTISSINSETGITLTGDSGTISSGDYVIEEIRIIGTIGGTYIGVILVKGLNYDSFSNYILLSQITTGSDGQRGYYVLNDNASPTHTTPAGSSLGTKIDNQTQYLYAANGSGSTNLSFFVYNIRASLTVGATIASAYLFKTGVMVVSTNLSSTSHFIASPSHGPGAGIPSIYYNNLARIYRIPIRDITPSSVTFIKDAEYDLPPFGAYLYNVSTNYLGPMWYSSSLDRFILCNTGGYKPYITKYTGNAQTCETGFSHMSYKYDYTYSYGTPVFSDKPNSWIFLIESNGVGYTLQTGNLMIILPLNTDWTYAISQNQVLISPKIDLYRAIKTYKAYVNSARYIGDEILGSTTEAYKIYARASGISDNSGRWIELDNSNDLSFLSGSESLQFMFTFRIGATAVTDRIYSVGIVYEEASTDSHFVLDAKRTVSNPPTFVWKFVESFGSSVPTLRINIYDAISDNLLYTDSTSAQTYGSFNKTTNSGGTWTAWNSDDMSNNFTYIRYTLNALPVGLKVDPVLFLEQ